MKMISPLNLGKKIDINKYKNWNREELVNKIIELENELNLENSNKISNEKKMKKEQLCKTIESKTIDFSKYSSRFIALRFAYLGLNYSGLAYQMDKSICTVESVLIDALIMARLIPEESRVNPENICDFSRCGRTDKGVSALNQTVTLKVRSKLSIDEQKDVANDSKEIPYVKILNKLLPSEIRIHGICLRPPKDFDARFSCLARHYKYFFIAEKGVIDINPMKEAVKMFIGEHDFRNFAKLDGSKQITNYNRIITHADITLVDKSNSLYVFDLIGSAFLWNQVRLMMAALFLVGQNLEKPSIIQELLNVEKYPSRPDFEKADAYPLVLWDCIYPKDIVFSPGVHSSEVQSIVDSVYNMWYKSLILNGLNNSILSTISNSFNYNGLVENDKYKNMIFLGNGHGRRLKTYIPISEKNCLEHYENINKKWLKRKQEREGEM